MRNYLRRDKYLRIIGLVAASGSVGTAFAHVDLVFRLAAPVLATIISFWLLQNQYGSLARDAGELSAGWSTIARDYERLWNHLDAPDAELNYERIFDRAEALSPGGAKFPLTERLNYWLDQAAMMANGRYA